MNINQLIDVLVDSVPLTIKKRGLELYIQDHFLESSLSEDLLSFGISVVGSSGTGIYDVNLNYDGFLHKILTSCTCPYYETNQVDCKHIIAAAFQWKKQLTKSSVAPFRIIKSDEFINVKKELSNQTFIFAIRSLEYWELKDYQAYLQPRYIQKEEIIVSHQTKSCTLNWAGATVSATYVDLSHLSLKCSCDLLRQNRFCVHAVTLLHGVAKYFGPYYFRIFKDYSVQIQETYKMYGVKPDSELGKTFEFGIGDTGEFKIINRPPNLLPLSGYLSWENEMTAIQPFKKADMTSEGKIPPANIIAVGLMISSDGKYNLPFEIGGVIATENKNKIVYKRIAFHKKTDLLSFSHLTESTLVCLSKLSNESIVDQIIAKTGASYLRSYANPINKVDEQTKPIVLQVFLDVLKELILINDPGLQFYTLNPGEIFNSQNCKPVKLNYSADALQFHLTHKEDFWILTCMVNGANGALALNTFTFYPNFLKNELEMYLLDDKDEEIVRLFKNGDVMAHRQDTTTFLEKIIKPLRSRYPVTFDPLVEPKLIEEPGKVEIYLSELNESFLMIRPKWKYGEFDAEMDGTSHALFNIGPELFSVVRQKETEESFLHVLKELHPRFKIQAGNEYFYLPFKEALEKSWFVNFFTAMQKLDVQVFGISELKKFKYNANPPSLRTNISSGIDWFDLSIEIHYGEQIIGLAELKKAILAKQEYVLLKDGTLGILPEEWINKYSNLFKMGKLKNEVLQVAKFHYTLLDKLHSQLDDELIQKELVDKRERLQRLNSMDEITLPPSIKASLRDYQLTGFQWMGQLEQIGWGGCLADDMGLGKTLQTLAFLQHRIIQNPDETHLIVCPTSLLYNWEAEIQKFTPDLSYHIYYGADRAFNAADFKACNLIISSYGMVRSDIVHIAEFQFGYVILDESQNIKNPAAQITRAVQLLKAKNRLILSGTPVQNNTYDLYAQMNFLNPGILGNMEFFKAEFAGPIDKYNDRTKSELLKKMIAPFMLRRTKEQVAKDLPDKTETVLWCEMEKAQRKVYDEFKQRYRESLMERIEEEGMGKSSIYILEGLLKLRQICDSTALLKDEHYSANSVKMNELIRELTENTGTHKALIFSQFTEMLGLIRIELDKLGLKYSYLDGSTPAHKRKEAVDQFQQDDSQRVFLISLKAGGVGLNLTSADYVYLVDPWWNPAAEQQAIDRTHRIGQKNKIFAYKMICKDTVEEKIMQLQEKKKALAGDLIADESGFVKKLSKDDIVFLFS